MLDLEECNNIKQNHCKGTQSAGQGPGPDSLPREALPVLSSQTPPHLASMEVMGCVRGWRRHQVLYGLNGQDAHKHNFYRVKTWAGDIIMTEVRAHMAVSFGDSHGMLEVCSVLL